MNELTDLRQRLYLIADELRNMAALGKRFSGNVYETERAERTMDLAAEVAALADGEAEPELRKAYYQSGAYDRISPVVGANAVVFTPDQQLLLIQRKDNGLWALPGGIAEVGRSFPESALRELWEEAGMVGRVERLLGMFDARYWNALTKFHLISLDFLVTCDDLNPTPGIECLAARFFPVNGLPSPEQLHGSFPRRLPKLVQMWQTGQTHFDPADSRDGDMPMHQRH